jgi:PTS system fructose-specific IIC component
MTSIFAFDFHRAGTFLTLAVVILVGILTGAAARRLRLPSMTGQILGGLVIGRAGLDLFGEGALHALTPLTDFALGLIAVTVGGHLTWQRMRNAGRRLLLLFLAEVTVTPAIVTLAIVYLGGVEWTTATLYAAIAIATAPATIIGLVKETRSRGVFVKTLVGAVALNNMACIFLFEVARAFVASHEAGSSIVHELWSPTRVLLVAAVIGGGIGVAMHFTAAKTARRERLAMASVLALLLAVGLAYYFAASPLLTCLFLGVAQTNLTPQKTRLVDSVFDDFEPLIMAVFFTLAGMHLTVHHFALLGLLSLVMFVARGVGKVLAAGLAMKIARATAPLRRYLGLALLPQAGVAVGLVLLIQDDPTFGRLADLFTGVVLSTVTANELLGPLLTRLALRHSGELGTDRSRLLDFLQEENIVTDLVAPSKEAAIASLVNLLIRSHRLGQEVDEYKLLRAVLDREANVSTCVGGGLAIPHGDLPECKQMVGVMGLSRKGLPFEAPDGEPVHCIVLLATPPEERQRHLEVLAALTSAIGLDPSIKTQLFNAESPAHAYGVLHTGESIRFNRYLDKV